MSGEDPDYVNWIRRQPCCCQPCVAQSEAHHSTFGSTQPFDENPSALQRGRGKGQKAHDSWCMPLCLRHHGQIHGLSGFFRDFDAAMLREWQTERVREHRAMYQANVLDADLF